MSGRHLAIIAAAVLAACFCMGAAITVAFPVPHRNARELAHRLRCPAQTNQQSTTFQDNAATTRLVPGGARGVLLCRYHGLNAARGQFGALAYSRRITRKTTIKRLARKLNALRPFKPGVIICPAGDRSKVLAFLRYKYLPDDRVSIELSGCRRVSNGHMTRSALYDPGPKLVRHIKRLTHCRGKQCRG
jgi:hypothetical protein